MSKLIKWGAIGLVGFVLWRMLQGNKATNTTGGGVLQWHQQASEYNPGTNNNTAYPLKTTAPGWNRG